jgi:hypothetical protein
LIGTDEVNSLESTWACTDNSRGWPFQGINVNPDSDISEPGSVIGIEVKSGDIWGKSDSCAMARFAVSGTDHSYTYGVAVPGSHVPDNWGKAGLMARTSSNADAANFCIVRSAADHSMRVQSRAEDGDNTQSWDMPKPSSVGIDLDTWMYLKLTISNSGKTAEAWGSADGKTWVSVHRQNFSQPLVVQGIVGSSHDTKESINYLYFPVGGSTVAGTQTTSIGKDVSASGFAGVYPAS